MSDNAGNENKEPITINEEELENALKNSDQYGRDKIKSAIMKLIEEKLIGEKKSGNLKSITFKNINFDNLELKVFEIAIYKFNQSKTFDIKLDGCKCETSNLIIDNDKETTIEIKNSDFKKISMSSNKYLNFPFKCIILDNVNIDILDFVNVYNLSIEESETNKNSIRKIINLLNVKKTNIKNTFFKEIKINSGDDIQIEHFNLTNKKYTVDKIHINVENVIIKNFKVINRPKLKSTCVFSFDNFEVENKMEVESKVLLEKVSETKLPLRTSFDGSRFELKNNMNFSYMRKIMNSVDNVLEEQRFCKLELRSKRELKDTPWFEKRINFVYEHLFDYGHSIVKPFICLLSIWLVSPISMWLMLPICICIIFPISIWFILGIFFWFIFISLISTIIDEEKYFSIANIISFTINKLSLETLELGASFIRTLPSGILSFNNGTQWHHVLQSSISTIFWFFLLLAIRNNFKIRW